MPRARLVVNGTAREAEVAAGESLLTVLRERWDLTGAKYGCGEGVCGACTVLVDGKAVRSCVARALDVKGRVTTIEGLEGADGELHPMQRAFIEVGAFQCGYCTPGMILGAVAAMGKGDDAAALEGHICRCGAYPRIVEAVRLAERYGR
jgi:aerobic-type carbon monoxide dehydrogenase small subunit (CoxS/CutS family)